MSNFKQICITSLTGIFCLIWLLHQAYGGIEISFSIDSPNNDQGSFYYDTGDGLNENQKVVFDYNDTQLNIKLDAAHIESLRFDPLEGSGTISIKDFKINGKHLLPEILLLQSLHSIQNIEQTNTSSFKIITDGDDPHLLIYNNSRSPDQWSISIVGTAFLALIVLISFALNQFTKLYTPSHSTDITNASYSHIPLFFPRY